MASSSLAALVKSSVLKSESGGGGGGGGLDPDAPLVLNNTLQVGGGVGFNGQTPAAQATIGSEATNSDEAIALINAFRVILIDTGLATVGGG